MGAANVGNDSVGWFCYLGQQFYFTLSIGAHFNNDEVWIIGNGKQREWHTDFIIEVSMGGLNARKAILADHFQQFLGRCFSIATRKSNDGTVPFSSMPLRQSL